MDVFGKTTNNQAYYIAFVAFIDGLKASKIYGVNDIAGFTNLELICNQMKDFYQARKDILKQLHSKTRITFG